MIDKLIIDSQIIAALIGLFGLLFISLSGYFFKKVYDNIIDHLKKNELDNHNLREQILKATGEIDIIKTLDLNCRSQRQIENEKIYSDMEIMKEEHKEEITKIIYDNNNFKIHINNKIEELKNLINDNQLEFMNKIHELELLILRTNKKEVKNG